MNIVINKLKSFYRRATGKVITKHSPSEKIIEYKENAWKSSKMADYYAEEVEESFFGAVTSKIFTDGIPEDSKVLDVGAGTGRVTFAFANKGFEVLALDISKSMLSHINKRKGDLKIKTLEGSAFDLPFEDESYDVVTSMDVDIHFPNWEEMLKEKSRVCKKGGYIIFSSLSKENSGLLNDPEYVSHGSGDFFSREYAVFQSEGDLRQVASKYGLEVISITPFNFLFLNSMLGYALTVEEARTFGDLYWKAMANPKFRDVIALFEGDVVQNLPADSTIAKIVRFRKL